jgi:hypothetical protein
VNIRVVNTVSALALVTVAAGLGSACTGNLGGPADTTSSSATGGGECASSDNDAIRIALAPACKACHDVGSNRPIFASLDAFENLLVYDPAIVVPGDPDGGRLIPLLLGTATGTYTQMPLTGEPFAKLASAGKTGISMEAIRAWITTLPPPDPARAGPHRDSPTTRRLRVGELVGALQRTLGYDEVGATDAAQGNPGSLWVRDPDAVGGIGYQNIGATRTWSVLGGGDPLGRVKDDPTWSPGALRTVVEMSLEWCGTAVAKGDKAIFRDAAPGDTSTDASTKIRANIGYLHLRLLGEPATSADVDAFYSGVFLPAEPRGAPVAWTEVCAALVRDPRCLTF